MKKVLSMVLSAAMSVCLLPGTAYASSGTGDRAGSVSPSVTECIQFRDGDRIHCGEAVTVLAGLGIVNGMEDGTFQPQGILTRAQTAKLVSILVGQENDMPEPAQEPEIVFDDVAPDHWAASYIAYGAASGYLNGMGDGRFDPEGSVTVAHLATILDKILGYGAEDVGRQWPDSAVRLARESGLLTGVEKEQGEFLTREEAAQMIFNALKADRKVVRNGTDQTGKPAGDDPQELSGRYESVKNDPQKDYQFRSNDTTEQLVEKLFADVRYTAGQKDVFGHRYAVWKKGSRMIRKEALETPSFLYTEKKSAQELQKELGEYSFRNTVVYINGGQVEPSAGYIRSGADIADVLTGNGVQVEIYTNETTRQVTKIIAMFYELKEVSAADAEKETLTVDTGSSRVVITAEEEYFSAVASAARGEKLLVAPAYHFLSYDGGYALETDWSNLIDAYRPEEVYGALTELRNASGEGRDDGMAVIGGRTCRQAAGYRMGEIPISAEKDGTAYLDRFGYLKGYELTEEETGSVDWIYIKSLYRVKAASGNSDSWYIQGITESGGLRKMKLYDAASLTRSAEVPEAVRTKEASMAGSTAAWLESYRDIPENGTSDPNLVADRDSLFFRNGIAAVYCESAAGCFLSTEAYDPDEVLCSFSYTTGNDYAAGAKRINRVKVSDQIRTVMVGGTKADNLSASVLDGLPEIPAGAVCVIRKNLRGTRQVTTVFTEKESYSTDTKESLIRVTGTAGTTAYENAAGELRNDGVTVTYYDSADAEEKKMTVVRPENGTVKSGWYTRRTADGEAYVLSGYVADATSVRWDNTTKSMMGGFYAGPVLSGYQDMLSVAGGSPDTVYCLRGDEAVRDFSGNGITTVEDLVDAVNEGTAGSQVLFAYTLKGDRNVITQLYVMN